MTFDQINFEVMKLVAQIAGALLAAWLAVRWALRRYKSEKAWERQLGAYVDAVTALSEMRLMVGRWFDEAIERREPDSETQTAQRVRFQAARRKLDDSIAVALLLLPIETVELLNGINRDLENARNVTSYEEHLDEQWGVLDRALSKLIVIGRKTLMI